MATAKIETTVGVIEFELLDDAAPKTVENFVTLAKKGFYDGVIFHRVVPGFVIQGGCPKGDGTGGPGWNIKAEFNDRQHVPGVLSMARSAHPDSAGSQFFVCLTRSSSNGVFMGIKRSTWQRPGSSAMDPRGSQLKQNTRNLEVSAYEQ